MAGLADLAVSERAGYASASEYVAETTVSKREGYASVGELIGYGSIFHDRTAYSSVSENVTIEATSTREAHGAVAELIGYGEVFHDRTAYASVLEAQTFREPEYDLVPQPHMGWGAPLLPPMVLRVDRGTAEATASVTGYWGVSVLNTSEREAHASISELVVEDQQT